jgi:hypothetical protein
MIRTFVVPNVCLPAKRLRMRVGTPATQKGYEFLFFVGEDQASAVELKTSVSAIEHEVRRLNCLAKLEQAVLTLNAVGNFIGDTDHTPIFRERVVHTVLDLISLRQNDGAPTALSRICVLGANPIPGAVCVPRGKSGAGMADLPSVDRDNVQCLERKHALLLDHSQSHKQAIDLFKVVDERGLGFKSK